MPEDLVTHNLWVTPCPGNRSIIPPGIYHSISRGRWTNKRTASSQGQRPNHSGSYPRQADELLAQAHACISEYPTPWPQLRLSLPSLHLWLQSHALTAKPPPLWATVARSSQSKTGSISNDKACMDMGLEHQDLGFVLRWGSGRGLFAVDSPAFRE